MASIVFLGIAAFLLIMPTAIAICPSVCLCKWKSGKQTVECTDQSLTTIPSGIQNGVQVIDLSKNNLYSLSTKVFFNNGLINLQKIYISKCYLKEIADDAFYQVTNLIELDLSENLLQEVPAQTLKDCSLLRKLQLSHNPIQRIRNRTFSLLPHLTSLELSNCEIDTIEPEAFINLNKLEFLYLDNNKLKTLSVEVVTPLIKLYGLRLHRNPWYCDCHLRGLIKWMTTKNVPFSIPPKCDLPLHIRDKTWDILHINDFSCPPTIESEDDVKVQQYDNITLNCKIKSIPDAFVTWSINGIDINNGSWILTSSEKYWIEEDTNDYKNAQLTVIGVVEDDSGVYSCIASNAAGSALANITLSVILPELPLVGWSKAQIAGCIVGVMIFIIIIIVLMCIVAVRKKVLSSTDNKLSGMGFLKHLAYVKQNSVEVKNDKEISFNEKQPKRETDSSGYGSHQQTPDRVFRAVDMERSFPSKLSHQTDYETNWNTDDFTPVEWMNNRSGQCLSSPQSYAPRYFNEAQYMERTHSEPVESEPFPDESYNSYTSPAHSNWKRSPLVIPNNEYLSLSHEICYSPDEGYAEGVLEGTEV